MNPGTLLFPAALGLAGGVLAGRRHPRLWLACTLAGSGLALAAALPLLLGAAGGVWDWRAPFALGGEIPHLRLDGLGAFFLALVAVIGGAGAVYAAAYWPQAQYPDSAPRGRVWWSALLLSMGFVLVAWNGLHFLIAWEAFTVSAYFLITLDRRSRAVRRAGWLYLAASHAGTMCLFAFFALSAARAGSWDFTALPATAALAPWFWLALAGFSVKAGVFPVHVWLPSAHANAPSHVSAIMSGVAIKLGLYGILRFAGLAPVPALAGWVVLGVGVASALAGIAFAFAQNDLKRLLAYSSVENMGVIWIGLGAALLARSQDDAAWGRLALAGALLHVWNHGAFKSLLFLGAGSVLHATGTREMSRLGGLWRAMPWTAGCFAVGALAVAALPPLNGFVGEWLIYRGLFDAAAGRATAAWATMPAAIALAVTGALALATFIKAAGITFLGAARTRAVQHAHEAPAGMRGVMVLLAAVCVATGLAPALVWPAVARAAAAWHPAWTFPLPQALPVLGSLHTGLALAILAGAAFLAARARRGGRSRRLTWDCGYAHPAARMQYTSASFAAIGSGWLGWLLRPERRLRRPRGILPAAALCVTRVPETVLDHLLQPLAALVLRLSAAVRRLQHGHLQSYIFYIAAGLGALALLVLLQSRP